LNALEEKHALYLRGCQHIAAWCSANGVTPPRVVVTREPEGFATCAFYRDGVIYISVNACAAVGRAGRAWSYPGYIVDRTPYGVLAHELGHHVDEAHGKRSFSGLSTEIRNLTREERLTSYCPNDCEWFGEMFRLFVTNPDLLRLVRPKTWDVLRRKWPTPIETRWQAEVLADSGRHLKAAENKIRAVERAENRRKRA
jgi:hypothetical protein